MSVYAAGITGKGINVVVLDDGFDWKHPDIRDNYVSSLIIYLLTARV
jgi:subtilisin family serine protease